MLELKNIKKTYRVGETETKALDDISVAFREKEFVAILGTSGSGKTTCLNIIGGLDRYDSGELIIKGKKTSDFSDRDWDAYRNNSIGFIFQSYNLIPHLSIVANVELGMTLSGVSKAEKHKRALEVLEQVGLKDHLHKKPNQLSGGQMQRVAIARALANDPEILLCDEPTGALDTTTSIQIMDLIRDVAKDKLVIMVTHNPELARQYADRIVEFSDGKIISDTHPHQERPKEDQFKLKKTSMSFFTALGLSFNNIRTKKGRTFLTAFASSIGIIGIALILSLSTGFQKQIDEYQANALSEFPIMISQTVTQITDEDIKEMQGSFDKNNEALFPDSKEIYLYDPEKNKATHQNHFTPEFVKYVESIDPANCGSIGYFRMVNMNLIREIDGKCVPVSFSSGISSGTSSTNLTSMSSAGLSSYPINLDENSQNFLEKNYNLLAGSYPEKDTDLVLLVDNQNRLDQTILENLGFDVKDVEKLSFDEIIGTQMRLISNDQYYTKTEYGTFVPSTDYDTMYNADDSLTLTITGIIRIDPDNDLALLGSGIIYSDKLSKLVIDRALDSEIVKAQKDSSTSVFTMEELDETSRQMTIVSLGGDETPYMLMLYPKDFDTKDAITNYLDAWNAGKSDDDTIIYTDLAASLYSMTKGIMNAITMVLIAFAGISLVVSLIMICIITYTSVLERTKEIGVLRALGARKKDITRVFDAETCILGVFSGTLGVLIAWLGTFPINSIIENMTDLKNVATLPIGHAVLLVAISTILTMLGGHIPAKMASRKDAVVALRSE